jgi:hypothetical protein
MTIWVASRRPCGGRRIARAIPFARLYVLGDASYVNSLTCNATGTYQRDDTPYSRAFLQFWIGQSG